jgi:hypothetical protein
MHVRIIQAGYDRSATAVDHIRRRPTFPQNLVTATDRTDLSVFDSNRFDERRGAVRCDLGIMDNAVWLHAVLLVSPR